VIRSESIPAVSQNNEQARKTVLLVLSGPVSIEIGNSVALF
jgi:hypothetical protein